MSRYSIASQDVNCAHCTSRQNLSNRHLVRGCPHEGYKHHKQAIMQEISKMCKADVNVAEEQHHIFTNQTQKHMDLVFTLDNTQILIDVTTIDANNPSNGFIRSAVLSSTYSQ